MQQLALLGVIALFFGVGSYYATDSLAWFGNVNVAIGSLALLASTAFALSRLRSAGGGASRRVVFRGATIIVIAICVAIAAERLAERARIQFDWTFEHAFEPSDAIIKVLRELPGEVQVTLFYDPFDPRVRRTRLLLERIAREGPLNVASKVIDESMDDVDRFEVGSSNTVVLQLEDRFETVERLTEGTLYEALYRLRSAEGGVITVLRGEGEGDFSRSDDVGYAGLAAALATEGYDVGSVISATLSEVPDTSDLLLVVAPRRRLRAEAIGAINRFLDRGGALVALLEPGVDSGLEPVLERFGIVSPDAVVVDPMRRSDEADISGLNPVAAAYWDHPVTRSLDANRMTYFRGARSFQLTKPRPDDELSRAVDTSGYAWLDPDVSILERSSGKFERAGRRADHQPLVVAGRYLRDGHETRIVAFGDSDFASNENLRTLYTLDLILNAVHWANENESDITLRPKNRPTPVQFPIPLTNTLQTLYGVGLLVPELLLIAGGMVWLRRRNA
jgi:hypothetical protein